MAIAGSVVCRGGGRTTCLSSGRGARSQNLQIQVSKPGYQTASIDDRAKFCWGYEIWSFVWYVIPLGVDLADGAAWGHPQTMIAAHLESASEPLAAARTAIAPSSPAVGAVPAADPPE
jgi:hypothetical protein